MKVAIIGFGWVGEAMKNLFPDVYVYDPAIVGGKKNLVNKCDTAFVCVPTPNSNKGTLDTSIVEEVISWCKCPLIVIRSTVNPGTTDYLSKKYKKNIVMQPEYLGETPNHPMLDVKARQFMVLGGDKKNVRKLIDLYVTVYNANMNIRQVTAYEAELIKLTENRAVAFKVGQCQELYDACEKAGVDYYTIRDVVYGDDFRFDLWFSFIYPDNRGFNSKCIPKDIYAWCAWAESCGYKPELTKALLRVNDKYIKKSKKKA
jgi:nucleotide sugar dehydrogenase